MIFWGIRHMIDFQKCKQCHRILEKLIIDRQPMRVDGRRYSCGCVSPLEYIDRSLRKDL